MFSISERAAKTRLDNPGASRRVVSRRARRSFGVHRRRARDGGATVRPSIFAAFFDHATYASRLWYASSRARFAGSVMSGPSIGTGGGGGCTLREKEGRAGTDKISHTGARTEYQYMKRSSSGAPQL